MRPLLRVVVGAVALVLLAGIGRASGPSGLLAPSAVPTPTPVPVPVPVPVPAPALFPDAAPAPSPSPAPPSPSRAPPSPSPSRASPDAPVFLNHASAEDLRRLPGVGPKRADAILALRAKLGRFQRVEDLLRVRGVGRATLKKWRPLVRLDAPPP